MDNIQEILVAYIPAASILLGFLASAFGLLKSMKNTFKNSNIEEIKNEFRTEGSNINKRIDDLINLTKQLMEENQKLKTQNGKLLAELTRIADYEDENNI